MIISFSSGVIDSVSCQPYEPRNDSLDFPVGLTQHILYSQLSDMKLQLFDTSHHITTFRLSASVLQSVPLSSTSRFQMSSERGSARAFVELKVVRSQSVSSCSQSSQRFANGEVQDVRSVLGEAPVFVEESSLILPHSPLCLSEEAGFLSVAKGQTRLLQIPSSAVESVLCADADKGEKDEGMGRVTLVFDYRCAYLQKLVFLVAKDAPLYQKLLLFPPKPARKTLRYRRRIDSDWIELASGDTRTFLNTNSGHFVDVIPAVTEIKVAVGRT